MILTTVLAAIVTVGETDAALERFGVAAYSMEYRSAACAGMARVLLGEGDACGAARHARQFPISRSPAHSIWTPPFYGIINHN